MNLKLHLLLRMTLTGMLCWLGVSIAIVAASGRQADRDLAGIADQIQPIVAADVRRRWVSVDSDSRRPDLGGAAARFPDPTCLRYVALDGTSTDSGCNLSSRNVEVPWAVALLLEVLGPRRVSAQRRIEAYGIQVGTLEVRPVEGSLLQRQWRSVRDLLGLTAVTLLVLDGLVFWIIGRALRPAAQIMAAVEELGEGSGDVRLPALRPREFAAIADGINRLAARLAEANAARDELTTRLIHLQEGERRELAHELHEQFGQCVSALSAISGSLRQSVLAGEALTEADIAPLEAAVESMLVSLRALLQRMSQPPLARQGLRSALSDLILQWQSRVHNGPRIVFDADVAADAVPNGESALCIYRIAQECLNNIARHAPASRMARLEVRHVSHTLSLRVSNDIESSGADRGSAGSGMGLRLLSERVRALRGSFSVEMSAAEFTVQADLPAVS